MNKKKIMFYGPVDSIYGPGIKNDYTVRYLKTKYDVKVFNTYRMSFFKKVLLFFSLLLTFRKVVVAVSSGGRKFMIPILTFKKSLFPMFKYCIISINGHIKIEAENNKHILEGLKKADKVFVEIERLKTDLEDYFELDNISYFPNFKDSAQLINKQDYNLNDMDKRIKCVFLSRVSKSKGIDCLISSFEGTTNSNLSLDIYGPLDEDVKDLIVNLPQNVTYRGVIRNSDVTNILSNYDVFVFPSKYPYEGFPAAIIDAFSAGLFIISTPIAYLPYIVENGVNGVVLKDYDVTTLIDCLNGLTDRDMIKKIGFNNYNYSFNFSTDNVFSIFLSEFDSIGW